MDDACWVFFVAVILPSRAWLSAYFGSGRWNACVHRLDLCLYSFPKEFWGDGVRTHVNSKGWIPSIRGSGECRTSDTASRRTTSPTHYRQSCPPSSPHPPPPHPTPRPAPETSAEPGSQTVQLKWKQHRLFSACSGDLRRLAADSWLIAGWRVCGADHCIRGKQLQVVRRRR